MLQTPNNTDQDILLIKYGSSGRIGSGMRIL
jgi:hypothetical protein